MAFPVREQARLGPENTNAERFALQPDGIWVTVQYVDIAPFNTANVIKYHTSVLFIYYLGAKV